MPIDTPAGPMPTLEELVTSASRSTTAELEERWSVPVLVVVAPVETWSPDTLSSGETLASDALATHPPFVVRVAPRQAAAGNAAIRVGRSWSQSDVVLPFSTLSKRHALFHHVVGDEWTLEDVGSRNGTFLAGDRLSPGQRVSLRDGAKLKFGNVVARFSLAVSFREELTRRARNAGSSG
jgi:hypothetical protein